jgi:eukaryotic-like serine/threonine-protein kinase
VNEARHAVDSTHPNTVAVFDAGESAGHLFIVMELADGWPLSTVLANGKEFALDEVVFLGCQLLQALAAVHRVGIVHCDVKPGNVLIGPSGVLNAARTDTERLVVPFRSHARS